MKKKNKNRCAQIHLIPQKHVNLHFNYYLCAGNGSRNRPGMSMMNKLQQFNSELLCISSSTSFQKIFNQLEKRQVKHPVTTTNGAAYSRFGTSCLRWPVVFSARTYRETTGGAQLQQLEFVSFFFFLVI